MQYSSIAKKEWYPWFVVAVLSFAAIVSYVDRQVINLLVEPIKADLNISDTQISLVQGFSFAIFYALLSIPIARWADSGNRTHVITIGIICWSLATFSCGLAVGFWTLFAARVFVGAGEATLGPSGYSLLGDYFSKEKLPLAISIFTGSGFLGSGVALIIGAYVIDAVFALGDVNLPIIGDVQPWQLIFMLVSLPSILLVALMLCVIEPPRRGESAKVNKLPLKAVLSHILENTRIYVAIFIGFSLMASAQFSIGAWVPSFFIRTYSWSASEIGIHFGVMAVVFATSGVICGGWLATRLLNAGMTSANFLVPILGTLACIPFALAFPLMSSATGALTILAPALFFGAMPFGTGTSVLPQIAPNRMRAQVVAIYLLIANLLGFTVGPTAVALVTDQVFSDPIMLRYSLSIVAPLLMLLGALIVFSGLKSYRTLVERNTRLSM